MILLIFVIISAGIIAMGFLRNCINTSGSDTGNKELATYYLMDKQSKSAKMEQLVKAAAFTLNNINEQGLDVLNELAEERLVSSKYLKQVVDLEKELILERMIIKNEAEMLMPGSGNEIFDKARKIKIPKPEPKRINMFDEKLYLKRKEIFFNLLSS